MHHWLTVKRNYYLLDVWRGRLEFPFLRPKLFALASDYKPNRILIEQAGPGLQLIQELRATPFTAFPPDWHQAGGRQARSDGSTMRALRGRSSLFAEGSALARRVACMSFWPSQTHATMTRSTAFRSSSIGRKQITCASRRFRIAFPSLFTVEEGYDQRPKRTHWLL